MTETILILKDYDAGWYKKWYFPSGEIGVELDTTHLVFQQEDTQSVQLVANITTPDEIFEMLLVTDALQQFGKKVSLSLPYIPFGRQDRYTSKGSTFSLKVFTDMINRMNYTEVITYDPHSNVSELLIDRLKVKSHLNRVRFKCEMLGLTKHNTIVIAPDAGAEKRAYAFAELFGITESVLVASKRRNPATGEILGMSIGDTSSVTPKTNLLVLDDICDGGRTFIELAKVLPKERKSLTLFVTHGIFSKGLGVLRDAGYDNVCSLCDFMYTAGWRKNK